MINPTRCQSHEFGADLAGIAQQGSGLVEFAATLTTSLSGIGRCRAQPVQHSPLMIELCTRIGQHRQNRPSSSRSVTDQAYASPDKMCVAGSRLKCRLMNIFAGATPRRETADSPLREVSRMPPPMVESKSCTAGPSRPWRPMTRTCFPQESARGMTDTHVCAPRPGSDSGVNYMLGAPFRGRVGARVKRPEARSAGVAPTKF